MATAAQRDTGIPMPDKTPAALRVAVARLAPEALPKFDTHWATAIGQARDEYSLTPARGFTEHWWMWVAVARRPERLARFRELEHTVATSEDRATRREAAAEISRLLAAAEAEA
ncbi:DUF6247 family protein [Streptomyces sp. cg36]|uniref:DUF6247 family protein n=1 Tax=Streptomyces sp. cg36 TaxID=3238798 RepID=UPI0034E2A9CE